MLDKKAGVAIITTTIPNDKNVIRRNNTPRHTKRSSANIKEQLGLLLFHLHSTFSQSQRKVGYQLFEILLVQYLMDKGGMQ